LPSTIKKTSRLVLVRAVMDHTMGIIWNS